MQKTTKEIADLLEHYLPPSEARERANNIMQPVAMGDDVDYELIYASLSPSGINGGISDALSRRQAAYEIARILTVYRADSLLSAWASIIRLGFSAVASSQWLRAHGHAAPEFINNVYSIKQ